MRKFGLLYGPIFSQRENAIMKSATSEAKGKFTVWLAVLWLVVVAMAAVIGVATWNVGRWILSSSQSLAEDAGVSMPAMTACQGLSVEQIKGSAGPHVALVSDFALVPYESGVTNQLTQINLLGVRHAWLLAEEGEEVKASEWWLFSSSLQFDTHMGEVTARFEAGSGDSLIQSYYPQFEAVVVQFDKNGIAVRCERLGPIGHVRSVR